MFHHYFVGAMLDESNAIFAEAYCGWSYEDRRIALCEADEMYIMGALNEYER